MADEPKEIFPVRMATTENVVDFRPRREDPSIPDSTSEDLVDLGKASADSVPESASSKDSPKNSELPVLTTGVQIPASKASTPATKK